MRYLPETFLRSTSADEARRGRLLFKQMLRGKPKKIGYDKKL